MAIVRPPVSKDQAVDSWANQVTEAINKGLFAPSVNPTDRDWETNNSHYFAPPLRITY